MEAKWIALVLAGTFVCFCTGRVTSLKMAANNRCVSMHGGQLSPFASCSAAGYNNTFPFHESITEVIVSRLAETLEWMSRFTKNCSQNRAVADAMWCSLFVPKCVTSSPDPVLPCRRVCSEFLKQCGAEIERIYFDIIFGMCEILPNKTANSGECLEPKDFKVNKSIPDPLLRSCEPLIIPACQGKQYTHTILRTEAQKKLYRILYGSNYTKENATTEFPPFTEALIKNHPKCRANLEKHVCSNIFPPCFPPEGMAYYSLCKSACEEIVDDCPDVLNDRFLVYTCTDLAEGTTSHGYCKHTRWPNPNDWIPLEGKPTSTEGPATKGGPSAGVIAAAVIVPVILVGAFIGAAFYWKKRQLWPGVRYRKQEDDMAPVVTETDNQESRNEKY